MKFEELPDYLGAKELALYLQISMPTCLQYLKKGKIKAVKIGPAWRIAKEEVERIEREGLGRAWSD